MAAGVLRGSVVPASDVWDAGPPWVLCAAWAATIGRFSCMLFRDATTRSPANTTTKLHRKLATISRNPGSMCLHPDAEADADDAVSPSAYLSRPQAQTKIAELSAGCRAGHPGTRKSTPPAGATP